MTQPDDLLNPDQFLLGAENAESPTPHPAWVDEDKWEETHGGDADDDEDEDDEEETARPETNKQFAPIDLMKAAGAISGNKPFRASHKRKGRKHKVKPQKPNVATDNTENPESKDELIPPSVVGGDEKNKRAPYDCAYTIAPPRQSTKPPAIDSDGGSGSSSSSSERWDDEEVDMIDPKTKRRHFFTGFKTYPVGMRGEGHIEWVPLHKNAVSASRVIPAIKQNSEREYDITLVSLSPSETLDWVNENLWPENNRLALEHFDMTYGDYCRDTENWVAMINIRYLWGWLNDVEDEAERDNILHYITVRDNNIVTPDDIAVKYIKEAEQQAIADNAQRELAINESKLRAKRFLDFYRYNRTSKCQVVQACALKARLKANQELEDLSAMDETKSLIATRTARNQRALPYIPHVPQTAYGRAVADLHNWSTSSFLQRAFPRRYTEMRHLVLVSAQDKTGYTRKPGTNPFDPAKEL